MSKVILPIEAITLEAAAYADELVDVVTDEVLRLARQNARTAYTRRSGKLSKSIRKSKSKFLPNTRLVKAADPKAHLVEHGHDVKVRKDGRVLGHAAAHPFLGPAVDAVRNRLPEIIAQHDFTITLKK